VDGRVLIEDHRCDFEVACLVSPLSRFGPHTKHLLVNEECPVSPISRASSLQQLLHKIDHELWPLLPIPQVCQVISQRRCCKMLLLLFTGSVFSSCESEWIPRQHWSLLFVLWASERKILSVCASPSLRAVSISLCFLMCESETGKNCTWLYIHRVISCIPLYWMKFIHRGNRSSKIWVGIHFVVWIQNLMSVSILRFMLCEACLPRNRLSRYCCHQTKCHSLCSMHLSPIEVCAGLSKPSLCIVWFLCSTDKAILMDCGENSYMQLVRMYGPEGTAEVLHKIKAVYISHMHPDHHLVSLCSM
jgi:hypothetical protein